MSVCVWRVGGGGGECARARVDLSVFVSLSFDSSGTPMNVLIVPSINISRVLCVSD